MFSYTPELPAPSNPLAAENQALRDRIQQLEASQANQPAGPGHHEPSQARFRTVFENSPLGQKIIDPDLTIRHANDALVAMLGCTRREQVEGRRILDFAHPHTTAPTGTRCSSSSGPASCPTSRSKPAWCGPMARLSVARGTPSGFLTKASTWAYTTLIDITAHKEVHASLQHLYDAQEILLHLVAHDVRNFLVHIQFGVALLRQNQGAGLPKFLGIIEQAITQAKGLALVLPPTPVWANLNPSKFGRVIDNLLVIALKFPPTGGSITVRLREKAGRGWPCKTRAWAFRPSTSGSCLISLAKPRARGGPANPRRGWACSSRSKSCACTGAGFG